VPVNPGNGQPLAPGLILAHWNGHRWSPVITDKADNGEGAILKYGR
jgi:hypothetical protein